MQVRILKGDMSLAQQTNPKLSTYMHDLEVRFELFQNFFMEDDREICFSRTSSIEDEKFFFVALFLETYHP